jgi:uncharacterized phage protein (TIGR02218 family)
MLTIPAGFSDGTVTNLQVCWMVTRRDGVVIRGTEWDRDLTITTGTYAGTYLARAGITGSDVRSTSDLSVDNLEVVGALGSPATDTSSLFLLDVTAADIEAGLLDNAEAATFLVNADDPDLYQRVLRSGWIGNSTREAEGKYTTEMRGLTQALSQGIVRTYGVSCDAELGDARCKVDLTPFTVTDTVFAVSSRREFSLPPVPSPIPTHLLRIGRVQWTSGLNTGYRMEIKEKVGTLITLWLPMPADIEVGDTMILQAGCDKSLPMCLNDYDNVVNRRAHGVFVPGQSEILKVGKR